MANDHTFEAMDHSLDKRHFDTAMMRGFGDGNSGLLRLRLRGRYCSHICCEQWRIIGAVLSSLDDGWISLSDFGRRVGQNGFEMAFGHRMG